jgi:hypothetical protein
MINVRYPVTFADVVCLAGRGLREMTKAELNQGWQRLASRLAQGQHPKPATQWGRTGLGKPRVVHQSS